MNHSFWVLFSSSITILGIVLLLLSTYGILKETQLLKDARKVAVDNNSKEIIVTIHTNSIIKMIFFHVTIANHKKFLFFGYTSLIISGVIRIITAKNLFDIIYFSVYCFVILSLFIRAIIRQYKK